MSNDLIVEFTMVLSGGFLALSMLFKIYKRSISTFSVFVAFAIVSNLLYYGYVELAMCALIISLVLLLLRAIMKDDNDTIFVKPYKGTEKRNKRRHRHV